jgi:hypothetical protein
MMHLLNLDRYENSDDISNRRQVSECWTSGWSTLHWAGSPAVTEAAPRPTSRSMGVIRPAIAPVKISRAQSRAIMTRADLVVDHAPPHGLDAAMLYLAIKALISGIIVAAVSEIAKRNPGFGALIASLPLVSVLGMMWLWHDKPDAENMAAHAGATFWYVLPSLPMFLLIPAMLRSGVPFWLALAAGCALTIALYLAMTWIGPRFGLRL